jgi:hypothetical protein
MLSNPVEVMTTCYQTVFTVQDDVSSEQTPFDPLTSTQKLNQIELRAQIHRYQLAITNKADKLQH